MREPGGERTDQRDSIGLEQRHPVARELRDRVHSSTIAMPASSRARPNVHSIGMVVPSRADEEQLDDRGQRLGRLHDPLEQRCDVLALVGRDEIEHRPREPLLERVAELARARRRSRTVS